MAVPFVDGGRDMTGIDCWGLVRWVYRENLGVELPDYGEISATELRRIAREVTGAWDTDPWHMVLDPQRFDVVVMRLYSSNIVAHVGVMVDDTSLLHIERASGACIVPIRHPTVRDRIVGFRRHVSQL